MASYPDKTLAERRVYVGGSVRRGYKVKSIRCVKDVHNSRPVEAVNTSSLVEYSSGCTLHRQGCFGHMCVTPTGNLLPPHSLSFRSGDIRTQYYIASAAAFNDDRKGYTESLKRTNYGKEGHLRSIMSTPVSGSARLVAIPHVLPDPRTVCLSRRLAQGILFCTPELGNGGVPSSRYVERHLREGDYVLLERPPSLSIYNNQPFKLEFWDKECLGVHPKVFSYFHGDYDGDECHLYALGDPRSLREASRWKAPLDRKLCAAEEYVHKHFPELCTRVDAGGGMDFMYHTTLSFNEIKAGNWNLPLGNLVRVKADHMKMTREAMAQPTGTKVFLQDAIKGVRDITRQQTSQGVIGDMTRVAKISMMCFKRGKEGGTYALTRAGSVLLDPDTPKSHGSPSVRAVMVLCQASQQAALDAHRVGSVEFVGMDLVRSLLTGRLQCRGSEACSTLLVLLGCGTECARSEFGATWCYEVDGHVVAIAADNAVNDSNAHFVAGTYSPVVLSKLQAARRRDACETAVSLVYNYYGLETEGSDLCDVVEALCYKSEASVYPVTTRQGMLDRNLGWLETLMACDYTKLPGLLGSKEAPLTATSATVTANYSML